MLKNHKPISIVVLIALLAILVFLIITYHMHRGGDHNVAKRANIPDVDSNTLFYQKALELIGAPRKFKTVIAKAVDARRAILRGDYGIASNAVAETLEKSNLGYWHFKPFNRFISEIGLPGNPNYLKRLDEWAVQDAKSPTPYLLRSRYHFVTGWRIRGSDFASSVSPEHMRDFNKHLSQAINDCDRAIELDPTNPYSRFFRLYIAAAHGNRPETELAFQQGIHDFPSYYPLYRERLASLVPKWGGSIKELYEFTETYASKAESGSPLRMLYLELYQKLFDTVSTNCREKKGDTRHDCFQRGITSLVTVNLDENVESVLSNPFIYDRIEYAQKVSDILRKMVETTGGERQAGALVQLAAIGLQTDTELAATDTSENNYEIDRLTAISWMHSGRYDNAEVMFERALNDVANTAFPTGEDKDFALSRLYADLSDFYYDQAKYDKAIIYQKAYSLLRGEIDPHSTRECSAYFKLKLYKDAIASCTESLENGGGLDLLYWRAKSHEAANEMDLALAEYLQLADSQSRWRSASAINASVIYARRNDLTHMLEVLNRYTYLYDDNQSPTSSVAIAYNNRCYAKMKIGDLQSALNDCNASLKYGSLPDAFKKQQELLKSINPSVHDT